MLTWLSSRRVTEAATSPRAGTDRRPRASVAPITSGDYRRSDRREQRTAGNSARGVRHGQARVQLTSTPRRARRAWADLPLTTATSPAIAALPHEST
jgi:hypothetical protein